MNEPKVWVGKRNCKGKTTYHLRWVCPIERKWKSRRVGTDMKRAQREAAKLEGELSEGTYRNIRRTTWQEFVDEHVRRLSGKRNATEAMRTLTEFGRLCGNPEPRRITCELIESYVEAIAADTRTTAGKVKKGNAPATINKKCRYIRGALNAAVRRGYIARVPMTRWSWEPEEEKAPRIATDADEAALLKVAESMCGYPMKAFIYIALRTGGRRTELLDMTWDCVELDGPEPQIRFTHTKGRRDRIVPLSPDVVSEFRGLHTQPPFAGVRPNLDRVWTKIVAQAGVNPITLHDLRRTYCTRLIRAGVPMPTVQRLAGHRSIQTTLKYYNWVSNDDLRDGIAKLHAASAG